MSKLSKTRKKLLSKASGSAADRAAERAAAEAAATAARAAKAAAIAARADFVARMEAERELRKSLFQAFDRDFQSFISTELCSELKPNNHPDFDDCYEQYFVVGSYIFFVGVSDYSGEMEAGIYSIDFDPAFYLDHPDSDFNEIAYFHPDTYYPLGEFIDFVYRRVLNP